MDTPHCHMSEMPTNRQSGLLPSSRPTVHNRLARFTKLRWGCQARARLAHLLCSAVLLRGAAHQKGSTPLC